MKKIKGKESKLTITVANPLSEERKKELLKEVKELIQIKYYS